MLKSVLSLGPNRAQSRRPLAAAVLFAAMVGFGGSGLAVGGLVSAGWEDRDPKVGAVEGAVAGGPIDCSAELSGILEKTKAAALAVVVVDAEGKVWWRGAAGVRVLVGVGGDGGEERKGETPTPVTLDDKWHLGSCTKAMTATLCAVLVERGTLKWTTTIGEALPELAPVMQERWKTVTLEQLLVNRGGVPSDLSTDGLWGKLWQHRGTPTEARRLLAEGVFRHAPAHEPGTTFEYANAGFAIAGYMAETVTGTPWEVLIQRELFTPLGITSAGFGAPGKVPGEAERVKPDQPWGHRTSATGAKPVPPGPGADNPVAIGPAGIVHMTIADWAKFAALHARGPVAGWKDASGAWRIKPETFAKLQSPVRHASDQAVYAMGWGVSGDATKGFELSHSGSNTMWFCQATVSPSTGKGDGFAVVVCSNDGTARGTRAVTQATKSAMGQARAKLGPAEGKSPASEPKSPAAEARSPEAAPGAKPDGK